MRWIWVIVLVAACGKSAKKELTADEALAKLAPDVTARLDKIAAAAKELPSVDRKAAYSGPPLQPISISFDKPPAVTATGNALLAYAEDIVTLDQPDKASVPSRMIPSGGATECWSAVKRKTWGSFPMYDGKLRNWRDEGPLKGFQLALLCGAVSSAQKLVVIEAKRDAAMADLGSGETKTFKGGAVVGNLLVWDLASGKYEGARQFGAKSSEKIGYTVKVDERGNSVEPMADMNAVADDLNNNTEDAIRAALK